MNDLEKFKTKIKKIHKILTLLWTFRACSIGINRFNLNQFWLIWLRCSNRTLFWLFLPFLVETRFGLGRVITRLSPCNAGLRELCQDGGNSWSCCRSYRRRNSIGIRRRRTWRISAAFFWKPSGYLPLFVDNFGNHVQNVDDTRKIDARWYVSGRYPSFSTISTRFLSWLKKLINQKRFSPIEHEKTQPTKTTKNGWSQ